jgi:hypothetical protein
MLDKALEWFVNIWALVALVTLAVCFWPFALVLLIVMAAVHGASDGTDGRGGDA